MQIEFSPTMPTQASPFLLAGADELPHNIHFTLYAFSEMSDANGVVTGRLFEIQRFEIHHVVDLASPCYIDVGERVPFPGLHVSQFAEKMKEAKGIDDISNPPASASEEDKIDVATAIQRQTNIDALAAHAGPRVITSDSPGGYWKIATSCTDTVGIPPPECTDDAANARRLAQCQTEWESDQFLFEGTDRVLTQPLNGLTYGFVTGSNPINMAPIGGSAFFVDEALEDFEAFAIYWQYDDVDHNGQPDYPPSVPMTERTELGVQMLFGRTERPTRGVIRSHMTSLVSPDITAELAIFANVDEDDLHF